MLIVRDDKGELTDKRMVKNYLCIAQIDIDTAHRRASPMDNWKS
jgi:hypothetical protein